MIKSVGKYSYYMDPIKVFNWGDTSRSVYIGAFTSISVNCKIILADGAHFYKTGTTHPLCDKEFYTGIERGYSSRGDVTIGNDVWIGQDVTIMNGVTIGDGAIIAANTHVVNDVLPYSIVGGNPSKFIKYRFNENLVKRMTKVKWWEYSDNDISEITPLLQLDLTEDLVTQIEHKLSGKTRSDKKESSNYYEIDKLYQEILNRNGDHNGIMNYINSNLTLSQIKEVLYNSDEYRNKVK